MHQRSLDNIIQWEEKKTQKQQRHQELGRYTVIGAYVAAATTALSLGLAYYNGLDAAPFSWLAGDEENAAFFTQVVYQASCQDNPIIARPLVLGVGSFTGLTVGLHLMLGIMGYGLLKKPESSS